MKKFLFALLISSVLLQTSCSSDDSGTTTSNPVDVYVVGSKDGQACYWKNNQLVLLNSAGFSDVETLKIIVSDGDVYVLGYGFIPGSSSNILLWKNGVQRNIRSAFSTPEYLAAVTDMEIVGDDIYFSGYTYPEPFDFNGPSSLVYWKNDVKTVVDNFNDFAFSETRIKAIGSDVYLLASNDHNPTISGYYLNGVFNGIPDSSTYNLTTNDNQVYAYGRQSLNGFYYNASSGVTTNVSTPNNGGIGQMSFDNSNVYYSDGERIFKNGTMVYSENIGTNNIFDFKALDDNLYIISGGNDVNNIHHSIKINNVTTMTAVDGENFNKLFVVQN